MQLSEEEWGILSPSQKTLYRDVMLDIYKLTTSLGKDTAFPLCKLYNLDCACEKYILREIPCRTIIDLDCFFTVESGTSFYFPDSAVLSDVWLAIISVKLSFLSSHHELLQNNSSFLLYFIVSYLIFEFCRI